MKKRLAAFMAAMSMTAVMVGCGQEDPILGTWKADKVKASGVEINLNEFAEQLGQDQLKNITFTFEDDGKVTGNVADISGEGTWKADGDKYSVDMDGQTIGVSLEDGNLIFEQEGAQFVCVKQQ
ncbi:MAG TPA: lipocalin family protein [Candidatus Fimimorpha excrementavium]|nr:lipocalin family protein [Candidatus Fimimorpha excrementavium]